MIRLAFKQDIPKIRALWKECFGDPDSYLDFYFSHAFSLVQTYVDEWNGTIRSMATVVPAVLQTETGTLPAAYLYAVGTSSFYRGQGLASALIREIHERLKRDGVAVSCLCPAERTLVDFYRPLGYDVTLLEREEICSSSDKAEGITAVLEEESGFVASFREMQEKRVDGIGYPDRLLRYYFEELNRIGGMVLRLTGSVNGTVVCFPKKSDVHITESTLSTEDLKKAAPLLSGYFGQNAIRFSVCTEEDEKAECNGMMCVLDESLSVDHRLVHLSIFSEVR